MIKRFRWRCVSSGDVGPKRRSEMIKARVVKDGGGEGKGGGKEKEVHEEGGASVMENDSEAMTPFHLQIRDYIFVYVVDECKVTSSRRHT